MSLQILMIGPLSGQPGGATVLFRQLVTELRARSDVAVNVIDTTQNDGGFVRLLTVTACLFRLVWRSDVISLHVSSMQAALFAYVIWLVSAVAGRPWMLRIFGESSVKHENMSSRFRIAFDWIVRRCPLVMVETRRAENYFHARCSRVEWYPNNRPFVLPALREYSAGARRFVFIGHVKPSKGVREILGAIRSLEHSATVDLYGELRDGIRPEEFGGAARYCGKLPPSEAMPTLAKYDVLLLPTYYSGEGYPGVIVEAFAAGIPVIATRWQAIPEIVNDENGILIEPRDPQQLAAAMQSLMNDPVQFQNLRAGALRSARRFDSALWTERFLQSVIKIVQSHKSEMVTTSFTK